MTEDDATNFGRMMLHYGLLSNEAKKRARKVFAQIISEAKEDEKQQSDVSANAPDEREE